MEVVIARQVLKHRTWGLVLAGIATAVALSACGGGNEPPPPPPPTPTPSPLITRADAARFLTQATFGPTEADIDAVVAQGYERWLDAQLTTPPSVSHQAQWDIRNQALGGGPLPVGGVGASRAHLPYSFWKQAVSGNDQVRARVAYAWSQVFVISAADSSTGFNARGIANYMDMLNERALGKYRHLLEGVSLHPSMGLYLNSKGNRKGDPETGRVPDENYAREVMQLFSIGLYQLNTDGSPKMHAGAPQNTYGPDDVTNLAKVFTGWSYACPSLSDSCFKYGQQNGQRDTDRLIKPMQAYPQFHETTQKKFLGATIPDQGTNANPVASMKVALDTLAAHPNVGPFMAKQLIQRMVTSNPSTAYVERTAKAFDESRGDLKALVKAVLLDPEARNASVAAGNSFGKVREPLLRATAFLRAFGATSDSGDYIIGNTDDPGLSLGQTVMHSPSVFNFYRPGFKPTNGDLAQAGLLAPEMQITHETSLAGYANTMRSWVNVGAGSAGHDGNSTTGRDVKPAYLKNPGDSLIAQADNPVALVNSVNQRLLFGAMPAALKTEIVSAIGKIAIPAATGSNQTQIDTARKNRLKSAIYLTLLSPEFIVQK